MFRDACAADSEVGLQPKEESAVNDLIDRLEDIGHRQVMVTSLQMQYRFLLEYQTPLFLQCRSHVPLIMHTSLVILMLPFLPHSGLLSRMANVSSATL